MPLIGNIDRDKKLDEILENLQNAKSLSLIDEFLGSLEIEKVVDQLKKIPKSDDKIDTILKIVQELKEKFDSHLKKDEDFKRKLELTISKIREKDGDIADKLDELIHDWNSL